MYAVQKRIEKSHRPADETEPIRAMLIGALNTLLACSRKGSAEQLFAELKREPDGAFATRYKAHEFGKARFDKYYVAARHEETRWHYGEAPPWRDYTPLPVQQAYDAVGDGFNAIWYFFEEMPKWKRHLSLVAFAISMLVCSMLLNTMSANSDTRSVGQQVEAALTMDETVHASAQLHDEV